MTITPTRTSLYFEDFFVGQVLCSEFRTVTAEDLETFTRVSGDKHPMHTDPEFARTTRYGERILQGPFGLAAVFGLLNDMHIIDDSVVGLLDTNWHYRRPIRIGDELAFEMTITGKHRTSRGNEGVVDRHIVLRDRSGHVVQEGTSAVLIAARSAGNTTELPSRAFGTRDWGMALAERLQQDPTFASATASVNSTIALRSGADEIGFHIYRGRIIEVTSWTPLGPTFTLLGSKLTWTKLFTGPRNDFMEAAMRGDITVYGNTYEYRRVIKALMILVDHARALATEGEQR